MQGEATRELLKVQAKLENNGSGGKSKTGEYKNSRHRGRVGEQLHIDDNIRRKATEGKNGDPQEAPGICRGEEGAEGE